MKEKGWNTGRKEGERGRKEVERGMKRADNLQGGNKGEKGKNRVE